MSRGPYRFTQRELTRAIRAAEAAGVKIAVVEIARATGNIVIRPAVQPDNLAHSNGQEGEWREGL